MKWLKKVMAAGIILAYSTFSTGALVHASKSGWSSSGKISHSTIFNSTVYSFSKTQLNATYVPVNPKSQYKVNLESIIRYDDFAHGFDPFDYRKRPYFEFNELNIEWKPGNYTLGAGITREELDGVVEVMMRPSYTGPLDQNWHYPVSMPVLGVRADVPVWSKSNRLQVKVSKAAFHRVATDADWIAKERRIDYKAGNHGMFSDLNLNFEAEFRRQPVKGGSYWTLGGFYGWAPEPFDADESTRNIFEPHAGRTAWMWTTGGLKAGNILISGELVYKHPFGDHQNKRFQVRLSAEYERMSVVYDLYLLLGYSEAKSIIEGESVWKRSNNPLGRLGGSALWEFMWKYKNLIQLDYPMTQIDLVVGTNGVYNWDEDGIEPEFEVGIEIPTRTDPLYIGLNFAFKKESHHNRHAKSEYNWMTAINAEIPFEFSNLLKLFD